MPDTVEDNRKQLGSRIPPEMLKHLRITAAERGITVKDHDQRFIQALRTI
jgi:hypothetical protein